MNLRPAAFARVPFPRNGRGLARCAVAPALSTAALLLAAAPAQAATQCYTLLDVNDRVAYSGPMPPVDLSQPIKDGLQRRFPGGHLLVYQTDVCPMISLPAPATQRTLGSLSGEGLPPLGAARAKRD